MADSRSPRRKAIATLIRNRTNFKQKGKSSKANLRTACAKCNGRKSSASLDKWNLREKRSPIKGKYGEPQHWDGLTSVFVMLAERNPAKLTAGEREWLEAFKGK